MDEQSKWELAMAIVSTPMTLEEYLDYDDGTDTTYELVDGQLIAIPLASRLNDLIASFLFTYLFQSGVPVARLSMKAQIEVSGKYANVRQPDLMLLSAEARHALMGARYALITCEMPPPQLVVDVVNPNQENLDYRHKRTEYAGRHISEYWIVDPIAKKVTVLEWVDGLYEEQVYQNDAAIQSPLFPALALTAQQVLSAHL